MSKRMRIVLEVEDYDANWEAEVLLERMLTAWGEYDTAATIVSAEWVADE